MSKYKKNKAVALKYNAGEDTAPVVIASGYGNVAEKIIDIAEKKGIPVYKDDSTASMLCMLEVGCDIPVELYEVVAAIYGKLMEVSESIKGKEVQYYSREERYTAKEYKQPGKETKKQPRQESQQGSLLGFLSGLFFCFFTWLLIFFGSIPFFTAVILYFFSFYGFRHFHQLAVNRRYNFI